MSGPKYPNVLKAVFGRPWAMRPDYLEMVADLVRFRAAGGVLTSDEIHQRIAAASNGPRQVAQTASSVAVIPVYGPISQRQNIMSETSGGTSLDSLTNSIRGALSDPGVDAIVLEFDSPGGTVDGIPELAAEIRAARGQKPILAVANTMAASAAYWLAAQCEAVYCTPSGSVGSIGVFAAHHDLSAAYEADGDKVSLIAASISPFKTEGNEYEPLSDEARADIQSQVDEFGQMFASDVAKGRGIPVDQVRSTFGQGRVVLASDALEAGMVDGVGTLNDTIRQAARAAQARKQASTNHTGFSADLGSGLPFADRLALVSDAMRGLVEHASERADMRAKEGRALSTTDRAGLLALAGSLTELAAEERVQPEPEPIPTPSAWQAHARAQLAIAAAEFGVDFRKDASQ